MSATETPAPRYFLTYRGITLPLNLVEELTREDLHNRNTYFRASYDTRGRMIQVEKLVYGEVELCHVYHWGDDGILRDATISTPDEEPRVLHLGT